MFKHLKIILKESGLQYYTGVKTRYEYMKRAFRQARRCYRRVRRIKDKYSKAEKTKTAEILPEPGALDKFRELYNKGTVQMMLNLF